MPLVQAILWERGPPASLKLLDQRLLPQTTSYVDIADADGGWRAIREMVVRGAPALAVAAALSLAREACDDSREVGASAAEAAEYFAERAAYLETSRPTAVNLFEATGRMAAAARAAASRPGATPASVRAAVADAAERYLADDVAANVALGDFGADAVLARAAALSSSRGKEAERVAILTHCNAGALATAGHGTALGVIRSLASRGKLAHAFCTETRPYNQGARLTAFELAAEGLPATLLCDSAAAALLVHGGRSGIAQEGSEDGGNEGETDFVGRPHAVVVGADRVAANGDAANKVGTLALAVAARRGGVPFYVAAPTTTLDASLDSGSEIPIEQRPTTEVTHTRGGGRGGERVAAEGVRVWNPSFDVTPADLITGGIITEKGLIPRNKENENVFDVVAFVAEHATGPAAEAARAKIAKERSNGVDVDVDGDGDELKKSFQQLDCASAASYVASRPHLASLVGDPSKSSTEWDVREVGDGNINFVFVVKGEERQGEKSRGAIVVKQALPFIRIAPDWPLSVDRARIEAAALREHGRLLLSSESPTDSASSRLIPRVHHYDPERAVIAMDFVAPPAAVVRGQLVRGQIVPNLAEDVAEYAARTLFGTSLLCARDAAEWRRAAANFENPALCALTEQVVFTDPYYRAKVNRHTSPELDPAVEALRKDAEAVAWAQRLKARFTGAREALLHGDLHTGSVMGVGVDIDDDDIDGDGDGDGDGDEKNADGDDEKTSSSRSTSPHRAVVIDPEFAFYGPIGFDLGEFIANFLLAFFACDGEREGDGKRQRRRAKQRAWLARSLVAFWEQFELRFRSLWSEAAAEGRGGVACPDALYPAAAPSSSAAGEGEEDGSRLRVAQDVFLASVRDDAVRFAGCCVIRRVVGIAHVEDLEAVSDPAQRAACEARALRLGREMMVRGSAAFESFEKVVEAAEAERNK